MQTIQDYYIAPGAVVRGDVALSPGVNIWFGALIRGDLATITLGPRVNVQDGCIVHTDFDCPMIIEEGVVVGHGAVLVRPGHAVDPKLSAAVVMADRGP